MLSTDMTATVYIDTRSNDKSLLYMPTRRSINLYFTIQCADYDAMIGLVCRACGRNWQTNNKKRKQTKVYAYFREPVSSVEVNSVCIGRRAGTTFLTGGQNHEGHISRSPQIS